MRIHIAVSQPSIMDSRGSSAYYEGVASTVANHSSKETAGYHAPAPRQERSHAQASPGPALVAQALSGNRDICSIALPAQQYVVQRSELLESFEKWCGRGDR